MQHPKAPGSPEPLQPGSCPFNPRGRDPKILWRTCPGLTLPHATSLPRCARCLAANPS